MFKTVTLRVDEKLLEKLRYFAKMDNRSLSNFIETATIRYIENSELVDEFEMDEIINDSVLVERLNRGNNDAKNKKGSFIE